jgi:CubicO group peptidase (beta-lactamase class C family)
VNLDSAIEIFDGPDAMQQRLEQASAASGVLGACVAVVGDDATRAFACGNDRKGRPLLPTTAVDVSCTVKLYVAALVAALHANDDIDFDDCIAEHVDLNGHADYFDGISVRHLLSHTDGIGYRRFDKTPINAAGFIDVAELASVICSDQRAFPPSAYCTEGHFGFALLGALVEAHLKKPLGAALRGDLLDRLRPDRSEQPPLERANSPAAICPASGAGLALSALEMAALLSLHLTPAAFDLPLLPRAAALSMLFEPHGVYPGWAPSTLGCALGWKTFAGGWFGHNGVSPGETVLVRLHPTKAFGLVFVCMSEASAAYATIGRLLGEPLPELALRRAPSLLSAQECREMDPSRYCGTFGNRARRIAVATSSERELQVATSEGVRSAVVGRGPLLPATDDSFFIGRPNTSDMFFLQYLNSGESEEFDLIWDIRALWKRRNDG